MSAGHILLILGPHLILQSGDFPLQLPQHLIVGLVAVSERGDIGVNGLLLVPGEDLVLLGLLAAHVTDDFLFAADLGIRTSVCAIIISH